MDLNKEKIGFIGLGIMGLPMASNLMKDGFDLVVYNRTLSKCTQLEDKGAVVAKNPADVAKNAKVIITMVTDSPDVENLLLGENGIMSTIEEGSIVIDMSTISPKITKALNSKLNSKGCYMVDAPVSGGSWGAIEGTLSIMIGGEKSAYEQCVPLFESMGKNIIYTGESGMGQTTKLVNQILVAGTMNAVAEALVFAASNKLESVSPEIVPTYAFFQPKVELPKL